MMNSNSQFSGQQSGALNATQNQNSFLFGQPTLFGNPSTTQSPPLFGQNFTGQSAPAFGNVSSGNSASIFGQTTTNPSASAFGQVTASQSTSVFGQMTTVSQPASAFSMVTTSQTAPAFGQVSAGQLQSAPTFGRVTIGQSNPAFGQSAPVFGQSTSAFGQSASLFRQASTDPSASLFGQTSTGQTNANHNVSPFGQVANSQSAAQFGQSASDQSAAMFRQTIVSQSGSPFGQTAVSQSTSSFGQVTSTQPASVFGQIATNQPGSLFGRTAFTQAAITPTASPFGQTAITQTAPPFPQAASNKAGSSFVQAVTTQAVSPFAQAAITKAALPFANAVTTQAVSPFGQVVTTQSASPFGQAATTQSASPFGQAVTTQAPSPFGQAATTQAPSPFGQAATTQAASPFGQAATTQAASPFGQAATTQAASPFGQAAVTTQAASPFGQAAATTQAVSPFGQAAATTQAASPFGQAAATTQAASPFGQAAATTQAASPFGQAAATTQAASPFGQAAATTQSASPFGQVATTQAAPSFGQVATTKSASPFGQVATTQSASPFGQVATTQAASPFGQAAATTQAASPFGQAAATTQAASPFGQAAATTQAASPFGQAAATTQAASPFGQAAATTQVASPFGQAAATTQAASPFGQAAATTQAASPFGQAAATSQAASPFGQAAATTQAASPFGQAAATTQAGSPFGQAAATTHAPSPFGQAAATQSVSPFGQAVATQVNSPFGQAAATQSASPFGQAAATQSASPFGQVATTQSASPFGQAATTQVSSPFGQAAATQVASPFGQAAPTQAGSAFGLAAATQAGSAFGQAAATQAGSAFGQAAATQAGSAFGQAAATQAGSAFGQAAATQAGSAFGQAAATQAGSAFGQAAATQAGSAFSQAAATQGGSAFGKPASPFGQATTTQSASTFGQVVTTQLTTLHSASPFGQTTASKTAAFATQPVSIFNKTASVFGQTATELPAMSSDVQGVGKLSSAQTPRFGQIAAGHDYGFAQGTSSNLSQSSAGQSSAFISANPGQSSMPLSFNQNTTSRFSKSSSGILGKVPLFGEKNVFGQEMSHSGLATGEAKTEAESVDAQNPTTPSLNSENNFKPPANSMFKPIFGPMTMTEKPQSHGFQSFSVNNSVKSEFGNVDKGSSDEPKSRGTFSFSISEKKAKDETIASQPTFKSYVSAKSSDTPSLLSESGHQEDLQRKEGHEHFSMKHGAPSTDEASSARLSDHPPLKRNKRPEPQLSGGANIFRRILRDAVNSNKKTDTVNPKIEEVNTIQHSVSDTNISSTSQSLLNKIDPTSGSVQQAPTKVQPTTCASQASSGKNESSVGLSQTTPIRNNSMPPPSYQAAIRSVSTGPNQPVLGKPRSLLEIEVTPPRSTVSLLPGSKKTPMRRARRSDSTDSMPPLSPSELTAIQVRNVPKRLNQKQYLEKYFSKFGKVQRLYCKPGGKLVIVHFFSHTSAAHAKKMGTKLHKDVSIFWNRKKNSPNKKDSLAPKSTDQQEEIEDHQSEEESSPVMTSPCPRSLIRELITGRGPKGSPNKKSLVSKTIQLDTESCDSQASSSETTAISLLPTLSHLLGTVADTSEEKYRLLDQRDKMLRQTRVKRTELDQAKVFVGTCPDMCPEKERYMRETRNQLSIYEFFPGTDKLDHAAAVKEYSRSSADQEEPLPHELRPTHTLKMTMDYLVTQIMDQGDGNCREWYDFVWNRTRGIRKDIIQQHLCDLVTVSLIEKCTRFHIHCAYQLCEEPLSSFDPKINNENLTKCLQSLKEMYQDLYNRGVACPCEPEFRCYSVLLNLNKGDILREVQQFHSHVRNAPEVQFAVQVFAALNSTNFVRFFKLVRSASYLSSCILNGYFSQIRREGLRALNVAYTASIQRTTSFPIENIMRMLFFHDTNEAVQFLTLYGLSIFDGYVELNRLAFSETEILPSPKKCSFIHNKCQVSVGEIVNGAPLPPFSLHHPVCSFDAQNKYTGGISIAEHGTRVRQETVADSRIDFRSIETEEMTIKRTVINQSVPETSTFAPGQTVFQPIFPPEKPSLPPKPLYSDQDIVSVFEELVEDEVTKYSFELCEAGASYSSFAILESSQLSDDLLKEVISECTHRVVKDEFYTEKARVQEERRRIEEEARLKQEREELLTIISHSQCRDLLQAVLSEEVYSLANEELREAVTLDHRARILRCSQDVCDQYFGQFLEEELFQLSRESQHEMHCYRKYIQKWREVVAVRKKLRRQMRGFPAAPGSVAAEEKLKALIPSATLCHDRRNLAKGFVDLGHAGKLSVSITRLLELREQSFHKMKVQHFFNELLCDAAWAPLDLPPLLVQHIPPRKECIFWKVVLILPEYNEPNNPNCILSDWLRAKFYRADSEPIQDKEEQVHTLAVYSSTETCEDSSVRVNVCVKAVQGPIAPSVMEQAKSQEHFLGTSGLLFLLPVRPDLNDDDDEEEDDIYWISARLQLKQILQAKPFLPPLCLAVLVPDQCQNFLSEVENELNLADLVSCGLLSEFLILSISDSVNDLSGSKMVSSAVEFLVSHCPRSLELRSLPLRQYIEDGVSNTFSKHFYHDTCERKKAHLPPQDPAAIIDLYNCSLSFLAKAVSSEYFSDLSWPITEFTCPKGSFLMPRLGWNNPTHLAWLKKVMLSFQLPQMDMPPPGAPWLPVCSMILEYVRQICRFQTSLPVLISEVQQLLSHAYRAWQERKEEGDEIGPPVQDIPWNDLISICINHRLREWDSPVRSSMPDSAEEFLVYFLEENLNNFAPPETWEKARYSTLRETQHTVDSSPGFFQRSKCLPKTFSFRLATNKYLEEVAVENEEEYQRSLSKLKHTLTSEKEECKKFEEKLQHLMEEKPLVEMPSLYLPLYLPEVLLGQSELLPDLIDGPVCIPSVSSSADHTQCIPSLEGCMKGTTTPSRSVLGSETETLLDRTSLRLSLSESMDDLYRQLRVNQQEDRCFELHLKTLLDMGDL